MAWKSIWGKKGRSFLTMLGVIIGIAAVMTIVSSINGYMEKTMEQYSAMGSNQISVDIYGGWYEIDKNGNAISTSQDYFPGLQSFCNSMGDLVVGITPEARCYGTIVYGTKNTDNMNDWSWDETGNIVGDMPPEIYYGSDQYSACKNLTVAKGRDLALLDQENYNQVCVMGATAAQIFFGASEPVGKTIQINGNNFDVVGVYAPRVSGDGGGRIDNIVVLPYTARRLLGGEAPTNFVVEAKEGVDPSEVITRIGGYLSGVVDTMTGGYYVDQPNQWQQYMTEQLSMISLILGGIAAISLLVGGIGIMNIMLVTVTERTREIGIRRAIGAQRSSIVAQFLIEAAMLCGIGGIIGILLGAAGSFAVGQLMFHMTIFPAFWITATAFSLSLALGIIFGIYPAAKASNLQPVEALRAE